MALIVWNNILCVNISSIDKQHEQLVNILNNFYHKINKGADKEAVSFVLKELQVYIVYHFSFEENLLVENNYADLNNHINEHEEFINTIFEFEKRLADGDISISLEIAVFIRDWIFNHIMGSDKAYSEYLIKRGVN